MSVIITYVTDYPETEPQDQPDWLPAGSEVLYPGELTGEEPAPRRSLTRRFASVFLALCLLLSVFGGLAAFIPRQHPQTVSITVSGTNCYELAWQVLDLTNAERTKEGLTRLQLDRRLLDGAMLRARECQLMFSHTRPDGEDCSTAYSANGWGWGPEVLPGNASLGGENIASGYMSAIQVVNGWMNSPGHRQNILNPAFTTIGIGVFKASNGLLTWSQFFTNGSADTPDQPKNTEGSYAIAVSKDTLQCLKTKALQF